MRKRYLLVIIVLVIIASIFFITYYLSLPTTFPNAFNEPQNQGNETPAPFGFHIRFPWQATQTTTNESSGGGGGGQQGGGGGTGGSATNQTAPPTPKIKYTLNVDSVFEGLDFITVYYFDDILKNTTSKAPFSVEIDAETKACIGLISSYTGTYWSVDEALCSMTSCAGYPNGCEIIMDQLHIVTLRQYS